MEAKLVVVGGEAQQGEYLLALPTIVGRSRRADLKLGHPLVSRQHCELYEEAGALMVRDLGSLNGTFVGDARITAETPLEPGDLLTVGSVTFRAVYGGVSDLPSSGASAPADEKAAARPAEIEQTVQAGGLAALEQLRESEPDPESEIPDQVPAEEPAEDLNFGWLDEGESEPLPAPDDEQDSDEPEQNAAQQEASGEEGASDDEAIKTLDLGDHDEEVEDFRSVDPAKVAEIADEVAAHVDETLTIRVEEALTGEDEDSPPATSKPSGGEPPPADDDLDDFFKSLE